MASADLPNQVPIIPGGAYLKDSVIGGMPGPLSDSQQRHYIPDERDNFISWLRGEFAAANAIIDSLCHHLQTTGKPNEYDFVLHCIHQRRYNWTVVLHMQQYFSVAEVVFALQQVVWMKQAMNSDPSAGQQQQPHPPLYFSHENGGGPPWKEGPTIYRDPRGESLIPGIAAAVHHNSIPVAEEQLLPRKETVEGSSRKSEEQSDRRRHESRDQERQQPAVPPPISESSSSSSYRNASQPDPADQATSGISNNRSDSSLSERSSVSSPASSSQRVAELKEEKLPDQGSHEQVDRDGTSSTKLDVSEGPSPERTSTPHFHISPEEEDQRIANVKTVKAHSCMEQIEGGKMVNTLDGLELHEEVLDKFESSRLMNYIQDIRAAGKRGELGGNAFAGSKKGAKGKGREILQFGHSHHNFPEDHKRRSSPKDDFVPPVPAFLEAIMDRLVRWHIIPAGKRPDCCSINFMEEGDYVPPHLDNSHLERPYCTLVLQSDCTIILGQSQTTSAPGDFKGPFQLSVPVGSVLVFQRNSADTARHSIPAAPSKRIVVTFGKVLPSRPSRGYNSGPSGAGMSQSSPPPLSTSWGPSYNHNTNNRLGNNNNFQHNTSARAASGGGFTVPFKSHKYAPVTSSSPSSSGGVLPNPTARPPPPAQIISNVANSVPPLFPGTPGPPAGGVFPPPSMPIPTWSPLPRPPPPSRPPSAGTGVFFPSNGASSGPGRPVNMAPPRRSGNAIPSGPPLLQKTNSAPASFASLEVAAIAAAAAAAAASPPNPPSKPAKSIGTTTTGNLEKVVPAAPAARGLSPSPASTNDSNVDKGKAPASDLHYEANGVKNAAKEDNPVIRSSGRSSKSSAAGNPSRANAVSTGGGHS